MPLIVAAVLTTTALTASLWAWWHIRHVRRALARERAVSRLTEAAAERDRIALEEQIRALVADQLHHQRTAAVLNAADQALTAALDRYTPEGGPTT
ncbi:hypothetical protein [Streptomyces sp. NPDC059076]|uniref:hypothetical protein n=1 Tax=unclassified Streptomyces TaxID=2593676 RepID=UPI0036A44B55